MGGIERVDRFCLFVEGSRKTGGPYSAKDEKMSSLLVNRKNNICKWGNGTTGFPVATVMGFMFQRTADCSASE